MGLGGKANKEGNGKNKKDQFSLHKHCVTCKDIAQAFVKLLVCLAHWQARKRRRGRAYNNILCYTTLES